MFYTLSVCCGIAGKQALLLLPGRMHKEPIRPSPKSRPRFRSQSNSRKWCCAKYSDEQTKPHGELAGGRLAFKSAVPSCRSRPACKSTRMLAALCDADMCIGAGLLPAHITVSIRWIRSPQDTLARLPKSRKFQGFLHCERQRHRCPARHPHRSGRLNLQPDARPWYRKVKR